MSENEETAKVEKENSNLRAVLIERVNSVSSTLSLASLGLFGSLLDSTYRTSRKFGFELFQVPSSLDKSDYLFSR